MIWRLVPLCFPSNFPAWQESSIMIRRLVFFRLPSSSEASLPLSFLYLPLYLCPCPCLYGDLSYLFLFHSASALVDGVSISFADIDVVLLLCAGLLLFRHALWLLWKGLALLSFAVSFSLSHTFSAHEIFFHRSCKFVCLFPSSISCVVDAIGFHFLPS